LKKDNHNWIGKLSKKEKIKLRLELLDSMFKYCRSRIEMGYPIPDLKILIQPK